nr:hypothetical protein CFP56_00739 [Quercus suber]
MKLSLWLLRPPQQAVRATSAFFGPTDRTCVHRHVALAPCFLESIACPFVGSSFWTPQLLPFFGFRTIGCIQNPLYRTALRLDIMAPLTVNDGFIKYVSFNLFVDGTGASVLTEMRVVMKQLQRFVFQKTDGTIKTCRIRVFGQTRRLNSLGHGNSITHNTPRRSQRGGECARKHRRILTQQCHGRVHSRLYGLNDERKTIRILRHAAYSMSEIRSAIRTAWLARALRHFVTQKDYLHALSYLRNAGRIPTFSAAYRLTPHRLLQDSTSLSSAPFVSRFAGRIRKHVKRQPKWTITWQAVHHGQ